MAPSRKSGSVSNIFQNGAEPCFIAAELSFSLFHARAFDLFTGFLELQNFFLVAVAQHKLVVAILRPDVLLLQQHVVQSVVNVQFDIH